MQSTTTVINQLKRYSNDSVSVFSLRKVFKDLKEQYDDHQAYELLEAIQLNEYWAKKGGFTKDSDKTLSFLQHTADWIYKQLCTGGIKKQTDKFDQTVICSQTTETLPDFEKNSVSSNFKPAFSATKQSMLYLDVVNLTSLHYDKGYVVERKSVDKTLFRLAIQMRIRTSKFRHHDTKHLFEDKELLAQL